MAASTRTLADLTDGEKEEIEWAVHKALVDILEKLNVAEAGPGYSLYDEMQGIFDRVKKA